MHKTRRSTKAAVAQLDDHVPQHFDSVSKCSDDRDRGHADQVWTRHVLSDQSAGSMPAPKKIRLLSAKAGLNVPTTVLEAQKLIARRLAAIPEKSVLFAAYIARFDAFKVENESLRR